MMSKASSANTSEIIEYVIHNLETYVENYNSYGSYLTFPDYCISRVASSLAGKYHRYDVEESFAHPKLIALLEFYNVSEDEEDTKVH